MTFEGEVAFSGQVTYTVVEKLIDDYAFGKVETYKIIYSGRLINPNSGIITSLPNLLNNYAEVSGELYIHPRIGVIADARYISTYSQSGAPYINYFYGIELSKTNWTIR